MKVSNIKFLTAKQKSTLKANGVEKIYSSNERAALQTIVAGGMARTGSSGYSHGYASKNVYTQAVVSLCRKAGIEVVSGNDAPRGGANGEWVKAANKRTIMGNTRMINEAKKAEAARVLAQEVTDQLKHVERAEANLKMLGENPQLIDWKKAGAIHPAPSFVVALKHNSGMNWKNFTASITE